MLKYEIGKLISFYSRKEIKRKLITLVVISLLLTIGGLLNSVNEKNFIWDNKGQIKGIERGNNNKERNRENNSKGIQLQVIGRNPKNGEELASKEVTIFNDLKKKKFKDLDRAEGANEKFDREIRQIVNQLNNLESDKVYFPNALEDGTRLSWERNKKTPLPLGLLMIPLGAMFIYMDERERKKKIKQKKVEDVLRMLPPFIHQVILMVESGLILRDVLIKIFFEYGKNTNEGNYFKDKMFKIAEDSFRTDQNIISLMREFSNEIGLREMNRIVNMLADNEETGIDFKGKLQGEGRILWNQRRKYAEEKGKLAETKLTFPLGILLMVLVMITAAPGFLQM